MNPRRSAPEPSSAACVPSPSVPPSERFATNSGGAETAASETCAVVAVAFSAVPRSSFFSEIDAAPSFSAEECGAPSRADAFPSSPSVFFPRAEETASKAFFPRAFFFFFFASSIRLSWTAALADRAR